MVMPKEILEIRCWGPFSLIRIKSFNVWKLVLNCYLKLSSLLKNFLAEGIETKSQSNENWVVKLWEDWDQHSNSEIKSSTCVYMYVLMTKDNTFFLTPFFKLRYSLGFPGGISGKEPVCQCRRHKRRRSNPWIGKIPQRRAWQPTPVFLPGESHGQRSLAGHSI